MLGFVSEVILGFGHFSVAGESPVSKSKVVPYPVPVVYADKLSTKFQLLINDQVVPVQRFIGHKSFLNTAHFSLEGPATVRVTFDQPINSYEIGPSGTVGPVAVTGSRMEFTLAGPRYLIIRLNEDITEKGELLCLIADPPETDIPNRVNPKVMDMAKENLDITGGTLVTSNVQAVLDRLSAGQGGTVFFPQGSYRIGTIELRDNVSLYLAPGAVLIGSTEEKDFTVTGSQLKRGKTMDEATMVRALSKTNIKIFGRGVIDGNAWCKNLEKRYQTTLNIVGCTGVSLEGVSVVNSLGWTAVGWCRDVTIRDFKSLHDPLAATTDSLDICNCQNVKVSHSFLVSGDDAFCIKACDSLMNGTPSAWGYREQVISPAENISLSDSVLYGAAAAMKIGIQVFADIRHVVIKDVGIIRGENCFKIQHQQGTSTIEHITLENIRLDGLADPHPYHGVNAPFFIGFTGSSSAGNIREVNLRNLTIKDLGPDRSFFDGGKRGSISDLRFENLTMGGTKIVDATSGRFSVSNKVQMTFADKK